MANGFASNDLNKFGPFGRYNGVESVSNEKVTFTGSHIGAAAIIVSHSTASPQGNIVLARGGASIPLSAFTKNEIHEVGAFSVTSADAGTTVYVLKR